MALDDTRREFDGRLRTLRAMHQQADVFHPLMILWNEAIEQLGATDRLTVEIESALDWVGLSYRSAADSLSAYERLLAKTAGIEATPVYNAPNAARLGYARALRRAGSAGAIQVYRDNVIDREAKDPESRSASVARGNLASALIELGAEDELREARRICEAEIERRTRQHGPDASVTLVAREIASKCALKLWRIAHQPIDLKALLTEQHQIVEQRTRNLGSEHALTIGSQITLAEILAATGEIEEALWILMLAKARAFDTILDDPHRLGMVYAECCLKSEDPEDLQSGRLYAAQALQAASCLYGPGTAEIARCRKVLADVERAIHERG